MTELSKRLADHQGKGYVIAPAGFGKTHLIAEAVKVGAGRSLILTHTYAGVNALKEKLYSLDVKTTKYQVDTIASWALRFCLSYPKNSSWGIERPNGEQWSQLYNISISFLSKKFVKRIIHASYDRVYVDEYQDCSASQHAMISQLSEILPCCILGDPLQAIFDFSDTPVDWDKDIYPNFGNIGELLTPWGSVRRLLIPLGQLICRVVCKGSLIGTIPDSASEFKHFIAVCLQPPGSTSFQPGMADELVG